ncbi:MAG TPA: alpha/beta hydrolase-fold protein [Solimonas sp.]|nr:alpha/beta hydrolase-fold protein [Solimonas sp.]
MRRRNLVLVALLLVAALLAIPPLLALWRAGRPIPAITLAPRDAAAPRMLVVVLPGIADDLGTLQQAHIAEAIQQAQPGAEVTLTAATFRYYLRRNLIARLHDEIVRPARTRGIQRIWFVGASMGGLGTLLFERAYPGELDGLVLLAPLTGRRGLRDSIIAAGGLARWQPGAPRPAWHPDKDPVEVWRMVRGWGSDPARARRVWLVCGTADKFLPAARLIAPMLPAGHAVEVPGGHSWSVWAPAAGEIFARSGSV